MLSRGERGSVVTLICDGGDRYAGTYYSDAWVGEQGLELAPYTRCSRRSSSAASSLPRPRRRPRDHALDRVHDLRRDLVHPVGVSRVGVDLLEKLLLVLVLRHLLATGHDVAALELLHLTS